MSAPKSGCYTSHKEDHAAARIGSESELALRCLQLLVDSFNVAAADGVMCRDTVNVGWDGRLFDCDFNQQLDMGMK